MAETYRVKLYTLRCVSFISSYDITGTVCAMANLLQVAVGTVEVRKSVPFYKIVGSYMITVRSQ